MATRDTPSVLITQRERVLLARCVDNRPQRCERTLRWMAVSALHDVRHHLLDTHRQLA